MRIKFLGTGASEGIPSLFCNCRVCKNARAVGGKEIRARTGIMIDENLMIDFPPDIFSTALRFGVDLLKLKYLLVTHSHCDHLNLDDLVARNKFNALGNEIQILKVYSNDCVIEKIRNHSYDFQSEHTFEFNKLSLMISENMGKYKITAFRAEHMIEEESLVFLIEKEGKRYLHLTDIGNDLKAVKEYLQKNRLTIDVAAIDTTYGFIQEEFWGHMNFSQVVNACKTFREANLFTDKTQIYLTHIAHCGKCTHEELQKEASKYGINVAYDGLDIEI